VISPGNMKQNILIISSGGREHAIGWKLKQSPHVAKLYFAPGSPGTATLGENTNIAALDFETLTKFVKQNNIDLTVAGPDDILAAGIVNAFQKEGLKIFGPTKEAAQIESSKAFAKQLMQEENIPTATFKPFTDATLAKKYIQTNGAPIVIKASGLALGKGVIIAHTIKEAENAIDAMMISKQFGDAGNEVVVEEFLTGREVSIHAFSDGENVTLFPPSRDHKTIYENTVGPNTGGMGTIAPVTDVTKEDLETIKNTIILPVIKGLKKRGMPFVGCLYPGLMITKDGPKVIEFNCRFGDPETESYMRLLESDLFEVLTACVDKRLDQTKITWTNNAACCIILASEGYPGSYKKGVEIHGLETITDNDIVPFHLGTAMINGKIVTNGGRVLGVTAIGKDMDEALKKAYTSIGPHGIYFDGMQYRKDIGKH
jgi:phosphoribosylamine--glycine ligase